MKALYGTSTNENTTYVCIKKSQHLYTFICMYIYNTKFWPDRVSLTEPKKKAIPFVDESFY